MLKLFIVCLPYLLHYLNVRQGMVALSEVDAGVIQKYFIFQASLSCKALTMVPCVLGCKQDQAGLRGGPAWSWCQKHCC